VSGDRSGLPAVVKHGAAVTAPTLRNSLIDLPFLYFSTLEDHGQQAAIVSSKSIARQFQMRRLITMAWQRGEPRVCAMVVPPTPEQEDRRRTSRERAVLLQERVRHVNRIKGLLASQGITDYEPLHKGPAL
jgi:transposase